MQIEQSTDYNIKYSDLANKYNSLLKDHKEMENKYTTIKRKNEEEIHQLYFLNS